MGKVLLEEVFGVSRKPIRSYLVRERVDGAFRIALKSDKQVVVYGSSKQGKTALVDKYVHYKENIVVSCHPSFSTEDIYKTLLRELNVNFVTEATKGSARSMGGSVEATAQAKFPFVASGEVSGSVKGELGSTASEMSSPIPVNLSSPQDVAHTLNKIKNEKFIILENFHYLSEDAQKMFAVDLRIFQELGMRFIILGVWRQKDRLTMFNGDLVDRITEIPVEPWNEDEFRGVISNGEKELNVRFSRELVIETIRNAFDSVGVLQELLKAMCAISGITEPQSRIVDIEKSEVLQEAIERKTQDYSTRHMRVLESIAEGRRMKRAKDGVLPLFLPYYTMRVFLTMAFGDIVNGLRRTELEDEIKKHHHRPEDVRSSDIGYLLRNFGQLQFEKGVNPPVFDYDHTSKMIKIIDSTFYFFLRNADHAEILKDLMPPINDVDLLTEDV